jgi:hypothetical protein
VDAIGSPMGPKKQSAKISSKLMVRDDPSAVPPAPALLLSSPPKEPKRGVSPLELFIFMRAHAKDIDLYAVQ